MEKDILFEWRNNDSIFRIEEKMAEELISVIVPIYKVEAYLPKCVESIRNQTYRNLEIILVDDGSPDHCGELCDQYANEDDRIKVIHKKNGGLSDARNAGIEIAKGAYIGFVDSDDYIHPQMYELLYYGIKEKDAQIAVCKFQNVKEDATVSFQNKDKVAWTTITGEQEKFEYSLGEFTTVCFTVAWNKLYCSELFQKIRYPYGKIHEDEFTTYKTIELADRIVYTEEMLYYYVQRQGSIMDNGFDKRSLYRLDAYQERLMLYQRTGRYQWYEKVLYLYRLFLLQWTELLLNSDKEHLVWLKPYKKYYNQQVLKNVWKLPVGKKKIGYLYYALFAQSYYQKRYLIKRV